MRNPKDNTMPKFMSKTWSQVVNIGDIFLKIIFALKVNIYLQIMSIKRCLARFDQKTCIFVVFFGCSLPPNIINYACPNFRTICAMALQHEYELSTLPSIPSNCHVCGLLIFVLS